MNELVMIDLPGGPEFVATLRRIWDAGDAAMPLDRRLPASARGALIAAMAPGWIADADGRRRVPGGVEVSPGDALVVATSGSSGEPKGVVLTHDAVRASALATTARLGAERTTRWLACLPLSHIGGLAVITRALATGAEVEVHDGFNAASVERAARHGATAVSLVVTALARIDPALFRVIVLGGSGPPAQRPANAVTTYGLTETGSGVVYDGVPLDGVEVRVDDRGEIHVRGAMLMRAYRSTAATADRASATLPAPIDAAGWLATGDLGRWLDGGRLQVNGRRDELIITGGENVWPAQVEEVLRIHHDVADVAVTGLNDPEWGQRVVAWVVATPGATPNIDALRGHVRSMLPAFMAPKEVRLVAAIPRTSLGKVARQLLSSTTFTAS